MFCGCELEFGAEPNTHTCPVCLGHPGTLPVINEQAVAYAMRIALALGCEVAPRVDLPPQELLLPRPAEGVPDQPVRPSACGQRPARRRAHPPGPHGGGRREAQPRRRFRADPRLGRLARRLQPRRHAAGRDRHRARHRRPGEGQGMAGAAADDPPPARRLRREHGGGQPPLRRQRLGQAGGHGGARRQDRAQEHEQLPLPRARCRGGDRPPASDDRGRRQGRAGDAPLRPRQRHADPAPLEGVRPRLPLLPGARPRSRSFRARRRSRRRAPRSRSFPSSAGSVTRASSASTPRPRTCWPSTPTWPSSSSGRSPRSPTSRRPRSPSG